jgi:hypothetical protein
MLVRIEPARDLSTQFVSIGGGVYEADMPYKPSKVLHNGAATTKDTSAPTVNEHWFWDSATKKLKVKTASAPASNNFFICFYYIHLTGEIPRNTYETPTDSGTDLVDWQPLISKYPEFSQSIENILAGIFSISGSTLDLINPDNTFESYLTEFDSFNLKECKAWTFINSTSNSSFSFSGTVSAISISASNVSISLVDSFNKLLGPAYIGDKQSEVILDVDSFPNIASQSVGKPIPYIFTKFTPYNSTIVTNLGPQFVKPVDTSFYLNGVCSSYDKTISTSTNRTWILCRVPDVEVQSFGAIQAILTSTYIIRLRFASVSGCYAGMPIRWIEAGTPRYGTITRAETFVHSSVTYNIQISTLTGLDCSVASTFTANNALSVFVKTPLGQSTSFSEGLDYTVTKTTTSGGNKLVKITLTSAMESGPSTNFGSIFTSTALNPDTDQVGFRVVTSGSLNQADVIKRIVESSGLATDSTTFSAAGAALNTDVAMMIPTYGEQALLSYSDYISKLLTSTVGYLTVGSDSEIEYYLTYKPNPSTTLDSDLIDTSTALDGGVSVDIDYQDIYSSITITNPFSTNGETRVLFQLSDYPTSLHWENDQAKYLHGVNRGFEFQSALLAISQTVEYQTDITSSRRAYYRFRTATKNLDNSLGKDLYIVGPKCLGGGGTAKVKVLSIDKSGESSNIKAEDLIKFSSTRF